ncbi:MAG TPA: hypothetical protein H9811_06625 [Candidatus Gemmiger excrementigallinarum]|uniref:Uncharacterized protein n=1 Tax=Candidatus Gemmiger excrementigallinarum TaxID=2838609 RepID=A0A9D2JA77_9FIRM|nr:hypothetical protein [Candidatus Gemmiger excrementigallinarum]
MTFIWRRGTEGAKAALFSGDFVGFAVFCRPTPADIDSAHPFIAIIKGCFLFLRRIFWGNHARKRNKVSEERRQGNERGNPTERSAGLCDPLRV